MFCREELDGILFLFMECFQVVFMNTSLEALHRQHVSRKSSVVASACLRDGFQSLTTRRIHKPDRLKQTDRQTVRQLLKGTYDAVSETTATRPLQPS